MRSLFTSVNDAYGRVSMHGTREQLLDLQARSLGLPLHKLRLPEELDMDEYDRMMREALEPFRQRGVHTCVFGDIYLESLRSYREERLREVGMEAIFPLWDRPTGELAHEFIGAGFRAVVSCVDGRALPREFVGRAYDRTFLEDLPSGVDPCGENGEFHTFVWDGPLFRRPVPVKTGEVVGRSYGEEGSHGFGEEGDRTADGGSGVHWFIELLPAG